MDANYHIVIACSYLHVPGGYEKAITTTAGLFAEKGHRVTLLILDYSSATYYPVHSGVDLVHLPATFGITEKGNTVSRKFELWRDIRKLKRKLKKLQPDFLICTEYHFTAAAVWGGAGKICKIYSWEHHHFYWLQKNKFWSALSRYAYKKADKVVCLNRDEEEIFKPFSKTVVIPNFIEPSKNTADPESKIILTVAGLIHRKGIDLLLEIAAAVLQQCPGWKWKLIGEGVMKKQVTEFVSQNNLNHRFFLQPPAGPVIDQEYQGASLYVMTSRFEAFPMVLLEAMSFGLPCVSFDCPSGPSEIIMQEETGLLVPKENAAAMASALIGLINNPEKRKRMAAASLDKVKQYYPDEVYRRWKKLFEEP